jgi:hypothetical protein
MQRHAHALAQGALEALHVLQLAHQSLHGLDAVAGFHAISGAKSDGRNVAGDGAVRLATVALMDGDADQSGR